MSAALEIDVSGRLCAALDRNSLAMEAAEQRRRQMAADVSYIPDPITASFAGSALASGVVWKGLAPKPGWNWAIQHIAVTGLGTSDYVNLAPGYSTADAQATKPRHSFTISTAGTVADWHPGRTGFLLLGREYASVVLTGSSSATLITAIADVIQVSDEQLPYFLL